MCANSINVIKRDGTSVPLNTQSIRKQTMAACEGIDGVQYEQIEQKASIMFYDGIKTEDIQLTLIKAAEQLLDVDVPNYAYASARLILFDLYRHIEYLYGKKREKEDANIYRRITLQKYFDKYGEAILDDFYKTYTKEEIEELNNEIKEEYDWLFTNSAIRIAKQQYLARHIDNSKLNESDASKTIVELPQHMLMCIAMFNCQREKKEERMELVKRMYHVFGRQLAVPATPHLSFSRLKGGSSASCLVTSMKDTINSIFNNAIVNVALGSKAGAGWGIDISRLRSEGSSIGNVVAGSKGKIPLCSVLERIALYIDQGGKRKGAFSVTCKIWDIDILQYLQLRIPHGDERKRTLHLSTSVSVDNVFMERLSLFYNYMFVDGRQDLADSVTVTLFDPKDVPELNETYGEEFRKHYLEYEKKFKEDPTKFNPLTKTIPIKTVASDLFYSIGRTNYPTIFFSDTVNEAHEHGKILGIIRTGNLCQEVTMPADDGEVAVCNLASINLPRVGDDMELLDYVSRTLVRFLDNSVDVSNYPTEDARRTQRRYRSIGIGCMGEAEYIAVRHIHFGSEEHLELIDKLYGLISSSVRDESEKLAKSKGNCAVPNLRNAYRMCIAPNTSSGVFGSTTAGIEPVYDRVFLDSRTANYGIKITAPNINSDNWEYYRTAFEIDQKKMIDATARRQKYIDMSISHSIFKDMNGSKMSELMELYIYAWKKGLKTIYYLRGKKNENTEVCTSCAN